MAKDSGKVTIHGKVYETVASRVQRFREEHGIEKLAIVTDIISRDEDEVVMKATIQTLEGQVVATGYAEEKRSASQINRTSALEVAETSAIGRALAAFGMAGTEYASADEVANAIGQQNAPERPQSASKPVEHVSEPIAIAGDMLDKPVAESQARLLYARMRDAMSKERGEEVKDRQEILDEFISRTGVALNEVKRGEVDDVLAVIAAGPRGKS